MKTFLRFVEKKIENGHQTLQTTKDVAQYGAKHEDQYPNVAAAAKRLLVAPVSTVDCEEAFQDRISSRQPYATESTLTI